MFRAHMTSSEIAHEDDYDARHGRPRRTRFACNPILPPQGMCFLCHREPVIEGGIECLQCTIKADLFWLGLQPKL